MAILRSLGAGDVAMLDGVASSMRKEANPREVGPAGSLEVGDLVAAAVRSCPPPAQRFKHPTIHPLDPSPPRCLPRSEHDRVPSVLAARSRRAPLRVDAAIAAAGGGGSSS